MSCKFERVTAYKDCGLPMPIRKTAKSAAYDICAVEDVTIPSLFNQVLTLALKKVQTSEMIERLGEMFEEMSNDFVFMKAVQDKDQDVLSKTIVSYLERFKGDFTLTLAEMKELVKSVSAKLTLVPTGVKCELEDDQVLHLYIRSSCPLNNYLALPNGVGVIDADYYNNEDNEGHIFFQVINFSPFAITIKKGDIIGQGEITRFCKTDDDQATGARVGGFGSTSND